MLETTELPETAPAESPARRPGRAILLTLLSANLASAGAAVLVNIFAASYVNQLTGEAAWAAAAVVVAYLPPLFAGTYLGGLIDRKLRRTGVLAAELGSAAATVGCGVAITANAPLAMILALLGVRSLLVAAVRNSLTRWLKLDAPEPLQEGRMQLFILTILLALPTSGAAMGWASNDADRLSERITAVAIVFHLSALALIACLPSRPERVVPTDTNAARRLEEGLPSTVRAILSDRSLGLVFVACLFAQPVFQAAEQVLVSVKGSSMGTAGMARMQTAGGVGLLLGFGLLQLVRTRGIGSLVTVGFVTLGLACLLLTARLNGEEFVLPAFLGMTLVYELLDSYFFARFFAQSPPDHVARFSITVTNLGGTLMGVSAVGLGLAIDALGFSHGTFAFVVVSILYGLALLWLARWSARKV